MQIILSEKGHSKTWKPLKGIPVTFAKMEESNFGKNYYFLLFNKSDNISQLLNKFDNNEELEFYFFKNILYISIESDCFLYIIEIFDNDWEVFREQIKKDKKILVGIENGEFIENKFIYDVTL